MIGQAGNFFEVKATPTNNQVLNPALTIHSVTNFAAGVTVANSRGIPQKLTFSRGVVSPASKTVEVEISEEIVAPGAVVARSTGSNTFELLNLNGSGQAKITGQRFSESGDVTELAPRTAIFGKLP